MESEIEKSSQEISQSVSPLNLSENYASSQECERLWHLVKNMQAEVQRHPPKPIQDSSFVSPQIQEKQTREILVEYEKRLRAEVMFLQEKTLESTLPQNKEVQHIVLQQEQMKRKQQLKDTLSYLKAKRATLTDCIKQEEELKKDLLKIQESLKSKERLLEQPDSAEDGEENSQADAAIAELKSQVSKLKEANKYYRRNLKEMLNNFPQPPGRARSQRSAKNALDNTRDFDEDSFVSLSSIIGQLMEQSLNFPGQPYVDIKEDMWPQHIEFLLRSQIIIKDPDCSSRMKLIPFHL